MSNLNDNLLRSFCMGMECRDYCGIDLSFRNLLKAKFQDACFASASFERCNLQESDFSYAICTHTNFTGADLTNAVLVGTNLHNATLCDAKLDGAVFNQETVLPLTLSEAAQRGMRFIETQKMAS